MLSTYDKSATSYQHTYSIFFSKKKIDSGEAYDDPLRHRHGGTFLSTIMGTPKQQKTTLTISNPKEFRQVSAIIDVDLVPETCRRKIH